MYIEIKASILQMKHLDLITIIIGALTLALGIAGIIISLILRSEYMIVSICGCTCAVLCGGFALFSGIMAKRKS